MEAFNRSDSSRPDKCNGGVRYWSCPNARPTRRAACIALAAPWLVGKPTRTAGVRQHAEEWKRRGSKLLLGKPSQPSPLAGVFCIRRARLTVLPAQEAVTRGVRREALRCIPGAAGRNSEGGSWIT
jgi:hypothetical protein